MEKEILDTWCLMCGHKPLFNIGEDKYYCEECQTVCSKDDFGF